MKPSDLSKSLRQIAAKIDASKRPDRVLVARDLKRVLVAMDDAGVLVNFRAYDNTYVSSDVIIDTLSKSPSGPVWAGISGYGWLLVIRIQQR
jgi:monomeric isocitrate dehydrogenase